MLIQHILFADRHPALKELFAHRLAPALVLTLATILWGASFVITRGAVQNVPPLLFVGLRFGVAALVVAGVTRPRLGRLSRTELRIGGIVSLTMFGSYALPAIAMHAGLSSGRAAFITAVYVPAVPLLQLMYLRRRPKPATWGALVLACAGLVLLSGPLGAEANGQNEILALVGALSIAAEILIIGVYAPFADPRRLAIVECTALALFCLAMTAALRTPWPVVEPGWVASAIALGLASAGLQIAVNWAQRFLPPTQATLIYTMEPVWAALFGAFAGERMGLPAMAGGAMIVLSLLVSSSRPGPHP